MRIAGCKEVLFAAKQGPFAPVVYFHIKTDQVGLKLVRLPLFSQWKAFTVPPMHGTVPYLSYPELVPYGTGAVPVPSVMVVLTVRGTHLCFTCASEFWILHMCILCWKSRYRTVPTHISHEVFFGRHRFLCTLVTVPRTATGTVPSEMNLTIKSDEYLR